MVAPRATNPVLKPIMESMINLNDSRLITDGYPAYRLIKDTLPHDVIDHEVEYVRGDVRTQGIENYWSISKRGVYETSITWGKGSYRKTWGSLSTGLTVGR